MPFALVIAVAAFFITLIPLIGTVLTTIVMTVLSLFVSPLAALIVLVAMLVYMQVEAYVLTPKVMSKAVQVPGSIVLIAALAAARSPACPARSSRSRWRPASCSSSRKWSCREGAS